MEDLQADYDWDSSCQGTVPVAGAYYGVPAELKEQAKNTFLRIC